MPVGLLVVARNDAAVIERSILSARGMVDSMTVVLDTKSSDATRGICEGFRATVLAVDLPDVMADARNVAIDLARTGGASDYLLMLDPGDTLEGEPPARLVSDVYDVWVHEGGMRFPRIQLFRSDAGLRYEGLRSDEPVAPRTATRSIAPKLVYKRGKTSRGDPMQHAARLIERLVERPDDAHSVYDLAQAYRDAGRVEDARQWYEKRITMTHATRGVLQDPRTDERRYLSALEVAYLVEHDDASVEAVMAAYLRAHEMRPLRAEPLFHLACLLREKNCVSSAWHFARRAAELPFPTSGVVVDVEVYEWKAKAEVAIESYLLGDVATAMKILVEIAQTRPAYKEWADEQIAAMSTRSAPERTIGWGPSRGLNVVERRP